jgi:hypothetical protein
MRERVDGCPSRGEVAHHLGGNRGWVGADALVRHAMVAGHDDDGAALQRAGHRLTRDARQPDGQLFQAAQATGRLGE